MRTRTKILIVDDSPDFQLLVKAFLSEENYLTLSAGDTLQATGSALREKPSLIIVDIGLPGGDGWMLLDRLKSNAFTRTIPVVVVTGQTKQGLEEKSKTKGAVAFLNKPIEKQALLTTITQILHPQAPPAPIATQA
ncbi:MAG: response regulator [Nitrospira sp.]